MNSSEIPVLTAGGADALPPPVADHAAGRFSDAGVLVLKNLLPPASMATLHAAYTAHYNDVTDHTTGPYIKKVGDKRLMISLPVADAFAASEIFANPVALSVVGALLGDDYIMGSYVAVTSMPGAEAQELHVDQEGLFGNPAFDSGVPPYSVTLVIPLVGLNPTTGSTRFYPGSHSNPNIAESGNGTAPDLDAGDAILFDSRITHGGMANRSDTLRPILYCTYHRAWYRDVSNFRDMPPMLIDLDDLDRLDEDHRWLVSWAVTRGE
jgi:hypothetical protein